MSQGVRKLFKRCQSALTRWSLHKRIGFGSGKFTCVTCIMTRTFTKPMDTGDCKFIRPIGEKFAILTRTVGYWKDGVMTEERVFWDNATCTKQIGIGQ